MLGSDIAKAALFIQAARSEVVLRHIEDEASIAAPPRIGDQGLHETMADAFPPTTLHDGHSHDPVTFRHGLSIDQCVTHELAVHRSRQRGEHVGVRLPQSVQERITGRERGVMPALCVDLLQKADQS
jgi:hypothetical protein